MSEEQQEDRPVKVAEYNKPQTLKVIVESVKPDEPNQVLRVSNTILIEERGKHLVFYSPHDIGEDEPNPEFITRAERVKFIEKWSR